MEEFFTTGAFAIKAYMVMSVVAVVVFIPIFIHMLRKMDKEQKEFSERMHRERIEFKSRLKGKDNEKSTTSR